MDAATRRQVPAQYNPSTGNWVGIAARSTVFVYNTVLLPEADLPASIMDLQDPAWQGKWAASPSGADFQAIVSAILQTQGRGRDLRLAGRDEDRRRGATGATPP